MKIFKPVGSKERFAEIFQGVTKVRLNEAFMGDSASLNPENVLNMAFEQLKSGELKTERSNSQGSGEQSYVELVCKDKQGNDITFTFKVQSSAGDQDGVYNVNGVIMTNFTFDSPNEEVVELDESGLKRFNAQHGSELFDAIDKYISVEDEEPIDSLYEDAIRKIDSAPYGKDSFDKMQTGKAYADEKPINPLIRVKAPELDKFVREGSLKEFDKPAMKLKMQPMVGPTTVVSEEEEKGKKEKNKKELGFYPDQLGKKFKPKNQMPKKKKKPQTTVKISENFENDDDDFEEIPDLEIPNDKRAAKMAQRDMRGAYGDEDKVEAGSDFHMDEKSEEPLTGDDNAADTEFMNAERQGLDGSENDVNPETEMGTENDVEASDDTNNAELYPDGWKEVGGAMGGAMGHEPESDEIDKIAQDKEQAGEMITGGASEGKSVNEFDPEQILMGMRVEMEHSDDPMAALEITTDHLTEDPQYYTSQDTPDDSAQANASAEANADANGGEGDDKDTEDILLGFKPHNVGDEIPDTSRKPRMTELKESTKESAKPEDKKKVDTKASTDTSSDTASDTSTETSTKTSTSTEAYTQGNITITGGAGAGDTHVTIQGQLAKPTTKTGTSKVGTVKPKKVNEPEVEPEEKKHEMQEEFGFEEYQGNNGDRYKDSEGNEFVVRDKVKGGVHLKGQGGEKEVATSDLKHMKKINESENNKINNLITEEQIKIAKITLSRNIQTGMSKKEAVQILMNNNLKKIL